MEHGDTPSEPVDPEAAALRSEAEELRRQIESGAGTPEELRVLAERLQAHREREELIWRRSVRPGLARTGAGRARTPRSGSGYAAALLVAMVGLGFAAIATGNPLLALVPVLAVVVGAYLIGRRETGRAPSGPQ
jgi:hypothetical protein